MSAGDPRRSHPVASCPWPDQGRSDERQANRAPSAKVHTVPRTGGRSLAAAGASAPPTGGCRGRWHHLPPVAPAMGAGAQAGGSRGGGVVVSQLRPAATTQPVPSGATLRIVQVPVRGELNTWMRLPLLCRPIETGTSS